jgi:rubrerythrin
MASFQKPDNAELFFKCSQCGNLFEPKKQSSTDCPICGNTCSSDTCKMVDSSNEDY